MLAEIGNHPVLHWHGDTFDLQAGSELLASTPTYANQAFAVGGHALGLQFHAEVSPAALERWLIGHAHGLAHVPIDPARLRAQAAALEPLGPAFAACMERWLAEL